MEEVDLLATPTRPIPAHPIGPEVLTPRRSDQEGMLSLIVLTRSHNRGVPAISVPCGFTADGLPVGMQLGGRALDEATVLRAAHAYQQATEWHRRRLPV